MSTPADQLDTDGSPQGALSSLQAPEVSASGRAWGENYLKAHPEGVDTTGESALLQRQDADAQEARTALQKARERLASQRMDPSVLGLRFAQAMMAPSKYGIPDQWGNAAGAVADWREKNQAFQQHQGEEDVGLAEKLSGVDKQSLAARLALQELKERTQASLMGTAIKATAKPPGPTSAESPIGKMVEDRYGVGSLQTDAGKAAFDAFAAAKEPAQLGDMGQNDIDLLGDRYFETGQMPAVGMGKDATALRKQIVHSATLRATGKRDPVTDASGQGASAAITGNAAGTKATGSMLTDMTKRTAVADASEQTASTNLDLAYNLMTKADQMGSPLINAIQNKIRSGVLGDPDVSAYTNALTTAANEYARVVSMATGAAGITDAARKEGHDLFNPMLAPEQLRHNIEVSKQEMSNRTGSLHTQIAEAKKGLYKGPQKAGADTPTTPPAKAKVSLDDYLKGQGF